MNENAETPFPQAEVVAAAFNFYISTVIGCNRSGHYEEKFWALAAPYAEDWQRQTVDVLKFEMSSPYGYTPPEVVEFDMRIQEVLEQYRDAHRRHTAQAQKSYEERTGAPGVHTRRKTAREAEERQVEERVAGRGKLARELAQRLRIDEGVALGAVFLTEKLGSWAKDISLDTLDLDSNYDCILGQLRNHPAITAPCNDYSDVRRALNTHKELGDTGVFASSIYHDDWVTVIRHLRGN